MAKASQGKSTDPGYYNPLEILNIARKAVPAVDYALGVAGVAAAGAIIGAILGYGRVSIIVLGGTLVAMVLLFAFAQLVAAKTGSAFFAGIVLLWTIIFFFCTFLLFTITAFAVTWPEPWARFLGVVELHQSPLHKAGPVAIDAIRVVNRGPIWKNPSLDTDEVVISVHGELNISEPHVNSAGIVAFWRLAEGFVTNWHLGRRTIGGNYKIAVLEGESASSGPWDFIVGGIEIPKDKKVTVSVVLVVIKQDTINSFAEKWLNDDLGWGFQELPQQGRIAISAPVSFETSPVRS